LRSKIKFEAMMILECKYCEAVVNAIEIDSYEMDPDDEPGPIRFTFCRCPKCSSALLASQTDLGEGFDEPYRMYPPQEGRLNWSIPRPIRAAYQEAHSCLKAKAHTAAAIMCRKTLEGICAEHGTTERTLVKSLERLKEAGVIETRLFEWAEALRLYGNEAAHDVAIVVSPEDAKDLVEFTAALLEYLFTFRNKFEQFKERRAGRAKK
jgi:hypothetical protein